MYLMFLIILKFVYICIGYIYVCLFFLWLEWVSFMLDVYYVDKLDDGFVG